MDQEEGTTFVLSLGFVILALWPVFVVAQVTQKILSSVHPWLYKQSKGLRGPVKNNVCTLKYKF